MPLFKIHTPESKKVLIKASVSEIIKTAISKFHLDGEDQYKVFFDTTLAHAHIHIYIYLYKLHICIYI